MPSGGAEFILCGWREHRMVDRKEDIRMNQPERYREFARTELTPDQQAVFDAIAAPRGGQVPAPFHVLIESPELALFAQNEIPDALFEEAVALFGRRRVVELTGVIGYYSSLAILLRIFRVIPGE